jgi:hypothetical protein
MFGNMGIEHKMLRVKSDRSIKEYCGTSLMHPSSTRSIRILSTGGDPTEVARDVLEQYGALIEQRKQQVAKNAPGLKPDMRDGWLLWQESLREFLYFEQEMIPPNPVDYWAEWKESGGGIRKISKNLWVYENETGKKRYSITTQAGAKIQPYFDVPPPNDPNLYYFCVQGEELANGLVRVWVTPTTALILNSGLSNLEPNTISEAIIRYTNEVQTLKESAAEYAIGVEKAKPILITKEAYLALKETFSGVSDEHMMQLFARSFSN